MTTKEKKERQERAITYLREIINPGDTIYTSLKKVSSSGMYRHIGLYKVHNGRIVWLLGLVAKAGLGTFKDKTNAVGVSGCGMDMGYHLVYSLAHTLWPDGHECLGDKCPSNYQPHHHNDGGYALRYEWL